jgi:hypothetical protein
MGKAATGLPRLPKTHGVCLGLPFAQTAAPREYSRPEIVQHTGDDTPGTTPGPSAHALRAIHPPRGVREQHHNLPQWHELPGALSQSVIARTPFAATRTGRPASGPVPDRHPRRRPRGVLFPMHRLIHKGLVMLDVIDDGDETQTFSTDTDGDERRGRDGDETQTFSTQARENGKSCHRSTQTA